MSKPNEEGSPWFRLNQQGEAYRELYRNRFGSEAEALNFKAWQVQWLFPPAQILFILLAIVGTSLHVPAIVALGALFECVAVVAIAIRVVYRFRFYRAASRSLGISVHWYKPVPLHEDKYREWCHKRGLTRGGPRLLDGGKHPSP